MPSGFVTQFATAKLGVILVNINPAYRLAELEYALQVSGCRAVISAERLRSSDYLAMLQKVRPALPEHGDEWKLCPVSGPEGRAGQEQRA